MHFNSKNRVVSGVNRYALELDTQMQVRGRFRSGSHSIFSRYKVGRFGPKCHFGTVQLHTPNGMTMSCGV